MRLSRQFAGVAARYRSAARKARRRPFPTGFSSDRLTASPGAGRSAPGLFF